MYVATDEDGRIGATTDVQEYAEGMAEFDFPDDFDFLTQSDWRIVDGELVHDPPQPTPEEIAQQQAAEVREQSLAAVPMLARMAAPRMTDAQVLEIPDLFDTWAAGADYEAGDVIRHDGELYRVAQTHTSQAQWVPGEAGTESLYTHITKDEGTGYDVWQRPTGAHDAYSKGDRVIYNGIAYESTIDGNTWSPDEYPAGWKEVTD